jgi:hypothetical protein
MEERIMKVIVTSVEDYWGSTITHGAGIHVTDDGVEVVHFAGDWRPMRNIAEALHAGDQVEVELEDWQITGIRGVTDFIRRTNE